MEWQRKILYSLILVLPFFGMVMLNECFRLKLDEKGYTRNGITAINSAKKNPDTCSWICHNHTTSYCKEKHVKVLNNYFEYIDPIYFGIIESLHSTGSYRMANIIFLVILIPAIIYFLLIKSMEVQGEIKRLKQ